MDGVSYRKNKSKGGRKTGQTGNERTAVHGNKQAEVWNKMLKGLKQLSERTEAVGEEGEGKVEKEGETENSTRPALL